MTRPVRPVALVILTACMIYPGVTLLFQGLYSFVAMEYFTLVSKLGPWMTVGMNLGLPPMVPMLLMAGLGAAWVLGVLGLWAGDGRAYPLALLGALGSLLYPIGPSVMGVLGLIALLGFRERAEEVPA